MRICVENGTFTVAFLKEGLLKVHLFCMSVRLSNHSPSSVGGLMTS